MKLQKFIDVLYLDDSKETIEFYWKNGKDIFQNTKLLMAILNLEWSEKTNSALICLKWIINSEVVNRNCYHKTHFNDILPIYIHFSEYMIHDYSFPGVPFEESKDMQKGYIKLLKILVQEGKLENFEKDTRYQKFHNSTVKERNQLAKKYPHLENPYGFYG